MPQGRELGDIAFSIVLYTLSLLGEIPNMAVYYAFSILLYSLSLIAVELRV